MLVTWQMRSACKGRAVRIKAGPLRGRRGAAREDPHDRGHGQAAMYRRRGKDTLKPLLTVNLGMINPRFLLKFEIRKSFGKKTPH